jgi:hypothetical protein
MTYRGRRDANESGDLLDRSAFIAAHPAGFFSFGCFHF